MNDINLLDKYKPIIYLHKDENYFPSSIDYVLKNSDLVSFSEKYKKIANKPLSGNILKNATWKSYIDIPLNIIHGEKDLSSVSIYGIVNEYMNYIDLTYITFYPYNGSYNILKIQKVGDHFGDLEHLTIRITKDSNKEPLQRIIKVFFGAHQIKDGRWVYPEELEYENGRIVAYSALNGHGLYNKNGMAFRYYGLANDYLEKGHRWDPKVEYLFKETHPMYEPEKMGWIYYKGTIGLNGIKSLIDKDWFMQGESDKINYSPPTLYNENYQKVYTTSVWIIFFFMIYLLASRKPKKFPGVIYFLSVGFLLIFIINILKMLIVKYS